MTHSSKKNRIIFIDLMRAIAVLQMVQGHTVDVLLSNDYRMMDNPVFAVWLFMRGMTAPIFLFTSGTVFTYLFRLVHQPFETNPRVYKGLKRCLLLLFIGYFMRYPTATLVDFSSVTEIQWLTFFSVDVLQLIGTCIFLVLIFSYFSEKTSIGDYITFGTVGLFFLLIHPLVDTVQWKDQLPAFFASYMYKGTGSQFPLFPWAAYFFFGAFLGSYLAKHPDVFKTPKFSRTLFITGVVTMLISLIGHLLGTAYFSPAYVWDLSFNLTIMRIGFVLILTSVVSLISLKIDSIPKIIILIGRNTLLIYVVHIAILYGSAWNPGMIILLDKSLNVWNTVGFAIFMLSLMTLMVVIINKLKIKNKQLVT